VVWHGSQSVQDKPRGLEDRGRPRVLADNGRQNSFDVARNASLGR
jgi:hypothetical protein